MTANGDPRPRVVSVVGNDITNDSRVKKAAAAAAAAGYESIILCYTARGAKRTTQMGEVEVVRVPIRFDAKFKNRRIGRPLHPFDGAELVERHDGPRTHLLAQRRWIQVRRRNSSGPHGHGLQVSLLWKRVSLVARHHFFRVRRRGHAEIDRVFRFVRRQRIRTSIRTLGHLRDPIPEIADYEMAFGPILEELEPDIIHAHDFHMIGLAVTAASGLNERGVTTKVVYDAHEWIPGLSYPKRILKAWQELQRRYIGMVDAVIGVSPEQIDHLTDTYELETRPTLVLNAPITVPEEETSLSATAGIRTLREDMQLGDTARILVYHGNIQPERGVSTLIESLPYLDDLFHAAIIAPLAHPEAKVLRERAEELQVEDRVHFLGYVDDRQLINYLSTADIAVIPYKPTGNNDVALPNKLFESLQAGLPVVVSDMRALSREVRDNQVGLVFDSASPSDLADKIQRVANDLQSFREQISLPLKRQFDWQSQAEKLTSVYATLVDRPTAVMNRIVTDDLVETRTGGDTDDRPRRLAVGPRNMAGQAYQIANAVQQHHGIPSLSFSIDKPAYKFPIHSAIDPEDWRSPAWQQRQVDFLASFTHVLTESGTGPIGNRGGGFIDDQLETLDEIGVTVSVVLHGSEIRDPERHREMPYSPYRVDDELTRSLETATSRLRGRLDGIGIPIFVTTPDLMQDIDAQWLPAVVDTKVWGGLEEPFTLNVPTVLHMPTNSRLKGSSYIDPVLMKLENEGLIRYLRPDTRSPASRVPQLVSKADIVVDQIVIGAYGLMSCQTMAAGRLSVANISGIGSLRDDCPIVNATPDELESTMRSLLSSRDTWAARSAAGRRFVSKYHDGTATAATLSAFLGSQT